ncbi:hypothetical protein JCM3765_001425 [Sporobolomyces pararoseus]
MTPLLATLAIFLPSLVSAAVLPNPSSSLKTSNIRLKGSRPSTDEWCTPWFSGLVQTVRKTDQSEIVWKAVSASETGVMDGVKAMSVGKSRTATMEPDLEWFVTPTSDGLFEITSGAAPSSCETQSSTLDALSQHALAPSYQTDAECATPHVFAIKCSSCDRHSDSATGCLLHSRSRDKCVELSGQGKLKWGECSDLFKKKRGWIGEEERAARTSRQTWDITP